MKIATIDNKHLIWKIFNQYKKIFPYLRSDYLERMIEDKRVIFQSNVVIIFTKYKRRVRLGDVYAKKDDYIIHEMVSIKLGDGNANKVFTEFCDNIYEDIWVTTRSDNIRAIKFYKKYGFQKVSEILWKNNTIKGSVFKKKGTIKKI